MAVSQESTQQETVVHLDAVEAQRFTEVNLEEKLAAAATRLEAAERLLSEARAAIRAAHPWISQEQLGLPSPAPRKNL
jgi:hypothetical protein